MSRLPHIRRAAVIAAAGVLSFGGVAAAATGTNPLRPLLDDGMPVDSTTSTTTSIPASTTTVVIVVPSTTTTIADDSVAGATAEVVCPEGVRNHGEAVSQVAKDEPTTGAEHGAAVSAMAQSDCGKGDDEMDVDELAADTEPTEPSEVVCPEGVRNHGEAVSQVARDKSTTGAEHGAAVSEMARSDCGKGDKAGAATAKAARATPKGKHK